MTKNVFILIVLLFGTHLFSQNRVLTLDGDGDYMVLPTAIIDANNFSIEAWYRVQDIGGGTEGQNIIFSQRSQNIGCYNSAIILLTKVRESFPYAYFSLRTDESCSQALMTEPTEYHQWHHIAATLSQGIQKIYVDGNLVAATLNSQEGSYATNLTSIEIGRHYQNGTNYGFFNGEIDEVRIWDYGLEAEEIQSRMYSTLSGGEPGLLAYWNFDDSSGLDQSDHGHNGQFVGDATTMEEALPTEDLNPWGDLNNDSQVNVEDVMFLIAYILGIN